MTDTVPAPIRPLFGAQTSLGIPLEEDPLRDFRTFLCLVWSHLNLPTPTPLQLDAAKLLNDAAYAAKTEEDLRRLVIEAFRGVGKSWVSSAFAVWLLYINPQLNILVVSASGTRAEQFTTFCLRLIREIDVLSHLIPDKDQRQSNLNFEVKPARASHSPSMRAVGINGQISGSRADVIIADDIEIPNNSATQGMRDKLAEAIKEFDAVLKPGGRILYLGTPQTEDSVYNILPDRGYKIRVWPARIPNEKQREAYGDRLAPYIQRLIDKGQREGTSTDPQRFTDMDLAERELSYGRSGFALQFMLDTSLSDAERFPLRLSDLIVLDTDRDRAPERLIWSTAAAKALDLPAVGFSGDRFYGPLRDEGDWIEYTGSVLAIDPAGRGRDEASYAVVKSLNSYQFLRKAGGLTGGYSVANLTFLAALAKEERVNAILIESNFGDGMFTELLKPVLKKVGWQCEIVEVRHSTQKEKRIIDTLEPIMNQHRLIVDRKVIEADYASTKDRPPEDRLAYMLFYQMTRMTKDKGALKVDDRIDVLAMAVAYFVEAMSQDEKDEMEARREEQLAEEMRKLEAFLSSGDAVVLGGGPMDTASDLTWLGASQRR